ncbi:MAG: hypothetical protein ACOC2C_07885, partial [Cyclonatronaceae bacterium]
VDPEFEFDRTPSPLLPFSFSPISLLISTGMDVAQRSPWSGEISSIPPAPRLVMAYGVDSEPVFDQTNIPNTFQGE